MSQIRIRRSATVRGIWSPPSDKSISHRAIILGSLADGATEIHRLLEADDCLRTLAAFRAIGVNIERLGDGHYRVRGHGTDGLREPDDVLDMGNSGTGLRLIAGVLSGLPFFSVLTGDASLRRRPMARIVTPLRDMGASIAGRDNGDRAPLAILGGELTSIHHKSAVASAQIKSSVLLAGLNASGITKITEPRPSRDHTERMLIGFGAKVARKGTTISLKGRQVLSGCEVHVPGDPSSAAFLVVAALITPSSEVVLQDVGVNPTRAGLFKALRSAGARINYIETRESGGEPIADLHAQSSQLTAMQVDEAQIPSMVDEIPILAVAATQAAGETTIKGASELRHKESDRLTTIAFELRKMGADIDELPDGLVIRGPTPLRGTVTHSHDDHRIAMALAVAGLVADGETLIADTDCIHTSFPGFAEALFRLAGDVVC